jgi:AraC-like DNA-binding protein
LQKQERSDLPQKKAIFDRYLRVGPLIGIPEVLQELEVDLTEVMASVDLDPRLFDDPENPIRFATMGRLLKLCAARTQCAYFGLRVGQKVGGASLGMVGVLARHSLDVGSALRSLILHLHLHDRGAVPVLSVEPPIAMLGYAIYQSGVEGADQIYDGAIAIAFNIMQELLGPAWRPTEVLFSRRRPSDIQPYRRFFQAPLRFDAEQTALVFPAQWLDCPIANADPQLRARIEQQIATLEGLDSGDLAGQLRRVLRTLLLNHRSSLENVAQLFSMNRRTLNRRLQTQGLTFQRLVDEIRYEIAGQLLENTGLSMCQIALILNYADASAFTRAFRRWSGITPTAWRSRSGAQV